MCSFVLVVEVFPECVYSSVLWRYSVGVMRWRLKSPVSRLFTQPFIQAQIKENVIGPRHWPLCGEFTSHRFVWGIHQSPVNSPHKGPVTRKMFPFHDVIMAKCTHCGLVWRYSSVSTFTQVIACCLTAPNHYLNQCRFITSGIFWHSPKTSFS